MGPELIEVPIEPSGGSANEWAAAAAAFRARFEGFGRIASRLAEPTWQIAALLAARDLGISYFAVPPQMTDESVAELLESQHVELYVSATEGQVRETKKRSMTPGPRPGFLCLFTSGSTGAPKGVEHSWDAIQQSARHAGRLRGKRWLLCYTPTSYAGTQVVFSALNNEGDLFIADRSIDVTCRLASTRDVQVISATPTFWRLLISAWPPSLPPPRLEQATLGGEVVDQSILDRIARVFRPARITHIYASTEAGTAIAVSDGLSGFPARLLGAPGDVQLRVQDGVLEVKSSQRMRRYLNGSGPTDAEGWISTGDMVAASGDRVHFLGRVDGRLNVGGNKVYPEELEAAIAGMKGIRDCVVYAKPSPIVGSLLAVDVVLEPGQQLDVAAFKAELRRTLPSYKVPQIVNRVESIRLLPGGKKNRRG